MPLRSENVDRFNHDEDAPGYDEDVKDESNPIRAGYSALLDWVADQVPEGAHVVDLGCGTGNLSLRLKAPARLICVDTSSRMLELAKRKLTDRPCAFLQADLLEAMERLPVVDAFISTYAIHHLTEAEKALLFKMVHERLCSGGVAAFGDLMFEDEAKGSALLEGYAASGQRALVEDIQDEFFWRLDAALMALEALGFKTLHRRFSQLSFGVLARRA